MKDWIISHKKIISLVGVVTILMLPSLFVSVAHAQDGSMGPFSPIMFAVFAILLLVRGLVTVLIIIAGTLASIALGFNQDLVNLTTNANGFIYVGWAVFRDIANLGFVLGIVIIAIATIMRYKGYVAQSILWKLIVAALLVNFSLIIAGSLVNVSNVFSGFFIDSIVGARVSAEDSAFDKAILVGGMMADKFGYLDYLNEENTTSSTSSGVIGSVVSGATNPFGAMLYYGYKVFNTLSDLGSKISVDFGEVMALFVMILAGFVMFLVLLGFGATLLLRYFYLSFLLILSPLVWLLWVFPNTEGQWKQWWKKFIHWTIYAPTVLLFVWIAMTFLGATDSYIQSTTQKAVTQSGFGTSISSSGVARPKGNAMDTVMLSIMAGALIIGGMKAAQAVGTGGTALTIGAATKMGGWAKTKARRTAARTGRATLQSRAGKAVQAGFTNLGSRRGLRWIAGPAARGLSRAESNLAKQSQEHLEGFKKSISKMSPKELARLLPTTSGSKRALALEQLSSGGNLGDIPQNVNLQQILDSINRMEKLDHKKEAGNLMKGLGMNKEAMEALLAQDMEKYKKEVEKFFSGFSTADFKKYAENNGANMFSVDVDGSYDKTLPGLNKEQTKIAREAFVQHAITDIGKTIPSTATKLKDKALKAFYREIIASIGEVEYEVDEVGGTLDASGNPIVTKTKKKVDVASMLKEAEKTGDYGDIYKVLEKSSNSKHKTIVQKMKKGMDAVISGAYEPDKKEEKKDGGDKEKKDDSKGKK